MNEIVIYLKFIMYEVCIYYALLHIILCIYYIYMLCVGGINKIINYY